MVLGLLPSVQLPRKGSESATASSTGLSLTQVAYLGSCLITVEQDNLSDAIQFIQQNFGRFDIDADVRQIYSLDQVFQVLHTGAKRIFVTFEQLRVLASYPEDQLAQQRVVLTITPDNPRTNLEKLKAWLNENPYWQTAPWCFDGDRGSEYVDAVLTELDNNPPSADQVIWVRVNETTYSEDVLSRYPGSSYIVPS